MGYQLAPHHLVTFLICHPRAAQPQNLAYPLLPTPSGLLCILNPRIPCTAKQRQQDPNCVRPRYPQLKNHHRNQDRQHLLHVGRHTHPQCPNLLVRGEADHVQSEGDEAVYKQGHELCVAHLMLAVVSADMGTVVS